MLSGAISENEVLCTFGSDGRLIFRFWCEMSEAEIIEVLVHALTETAIEAVLKKLGCLKKARSAKLKEYLFLTNIVCNFLQFLFWEKATYPPILMRISLG